MSIPQILLACCDTEDNRYSLSRPFVSGDWIVATDGRIAARIRKSLASDAAQYEPGDRRVPKDTAVVFEALAKAYSKYPIPPMPGRFLPCKCGGKEVECDECYGSGRCDACECNKPHDCGYCNGTGIAKCEKCVNGMAADDRWMKIGPRWFSRGYVGVFYEHGAREICITKDSAKKSDDPAFCVIGDVECVLMPGVRNGSYSSYETWTPETELSA